MNFAALLPPRIPVYAVITETRMLSTAYVCQNVVVDPVDVPRQTRPLGRVILAMPSVCLGEPPFQA